jgi:Protein of unknown function (DUF4007)
MTYRVSGHESFTCRYTWLPKVVHHLARDSQLLSKEEEAMVQFGVGKNMVRSIRFWAQAAGVIVSNGKDGRYLLTSFANGLLGPNGLDPFLEDTRTLWLIHWNLSTNVQSPLLAWDYLLNRWNEPEIAPRDVVKALAKEVLKENDLSPVTLAQHFDCFLHTYVPTRGKKGQIQEDNLDCPLVELDLIIKVGERDSEQSPGRREAIYAFRREEKPEITPELFLYCLNSFWRERHPTEATLAFREVAHGHGSPGQIFKLPEENVRERLDSLNRLADCGYTYTESSALQQVRRSDFQNDLKLLKRIYKANERNH